MSKIITFSQKFQKGHPRQGEKTLFVEKILNQRGINYRSPEYLNILIGLNSKNLNFKKLSIWDLVDFQNSLIATDEIKNHTIRGSSRFKVGEMFTPAVWKGKPYTECQIIFAPDLEVVKEFMFVIDKHGDIFINNNHFAYFGDICKNDGLTPEDFRAWFGIGDNDEIMKPFIGQIIAWNDSINY